MTVTSGRVLAVLPVVAAVGLLAVGCGSGGSGGTPKPSASATAADELAQLAAKTNRIDYTATYALTPKSGAPATVVFAHRTGKFRLDVTTSGSTDSLLSGPTGDSVIACRVAATTKVCYSAQSGDPRISTILDAGVNSLLTTGAAQLAATASSYHVERAGTTPRETGVPAGTCFQVAGPSSSASPSPSAAGTVASGTYCFATDGVLTKAEFTSGTLVLTKLDHAEPADSVFTPPATPTPLPSP